MELEDWRGKRSKFYLKNFRIRLTLFSNGDAFCSYEYLEDLMEIEYLLIELNKNKNPTYYENCCLR
jgi:hypothetical protein